MSAASPQARVGDFYETHPYPQPRDDIDAYRRRWNDLRRHAESSLFWPNEAYRDDRSVLIAGCGTTQAAHYAVRWPRAKVVGIDISASSLAFTEELKHKHGLNNLEVRQLSAEDAGDLDALFDHVVCTGVLHHLPNPEAGLKALSNVLAPTGAMHLMVYAPYGRAGVYMLQDYCRRLGIGWSDSDVNDLAAALRALQPDHPIVPLLRNSPDFASKAGLADALLHPQDRSYSVPQVMDLLNGSGLIFGRWLRQAPYLPQCGALAATPHAPKLMGLALTDQYAAIELFRGTMTRHSVLAYKQQELARAASFNFQGDSWLKYVPIRLADTISVKDGLPPAATAVLINRNHTYTDLYLPVDAQQERLVAAINGERTIGEICQSSVGQDQARGFFQQLWHWDQIIFNTSKA